MPGLYCHYSPRHGRVVSTDPYQCGSTGITKHAKTKRTRTFAYFRRERKISPCPDLPQMPPASRPPAPTPAPSPEPRPTNSPASCRTPEGTATPTHHRGQEVSQRRRSRRLSGCGHRQRQREWRSHRRGLIGLSGLDGNLRIRLIK